MTVQGGDKKLYEEAPDRIHPEHLKIVKNCISAVKNSVLCYYAPLLSLKMYFGCDEI